MKAPDEKDYYESPRPEMLRFVPMDAARILEIGCAAGIFGNSIKRRQPCDIWGMELSEKHGHCAEKLLDKVIIGDVSEKLNELPERFFDCIVCNDILEHLIDPFTFIKHLKRHIEPGGKIICSIPNVRYYRVIKDLLINGDWRYKESGVLDMTHLRFFTKKSILRMFKKFGWEVLHIEGINPTSSLTFRILNVLLLGFIADAGYRQFAVIAKPLNDNP